MYLVLELILDISSSDTTLAYRFGRNICINCSSVSRMDSRTVDPNLVVTRFARTMGYGLFKIKLLILTEALAVASSNFFARSILYCLACKRKENKQSYVENIQVTEISI